MQRTLAFKIGHWRFGAMVCVAALLLSAARAAAQSLATDPPASALPWSVLSRDAEGHVVVRATRTTQPVTIDGRLDDAAYGEVSPITEFIQQEPIEGAPITEKTEAWVLFDDRNIYISCRCWDTHPERIVANDMRRDSLNLHDNDHFAVEFDTFFDGRNGFLFYVSPVSGALDAAVTDERRDINWNPVWDYKGSRFEGGWIAEMAIPFKSLRYGPGRQQTWHIQLRRMMRSKNERAYLTRIPAAWGSGGINHPSAAAILVGLEVPAPAWNLEIKPYAISGVTTDLLVRPTVRNHVKPEAGIDLKYGVTKSLSADFTYNTDFAQVEADDVQVNLTRFSLLFPEKRDFFLESAGVFEFGNVGSTGLNRGDAPTIFYSRRIGLSETGAVPVVGGGRLAGKIGLWSVGALNIQVGDDATVGAVKPNFSVVRLRRNILRRSTIGGIYTRRSISTISTGGNDVWGLDGNFVFHQNIYLGGYVAQSRTEGRSGNDLAYRAQFNYTGDRYGLAVDRMVVEQNFNPEVGLLRRENFRRNYVQARFSPRTKHSRLVRKWTYQGEVDYITDNDGRLQARELRGRFRTEFHSSDSIDVQYARLYDFLPVPFLISSGVHIPTGAYSFENLVMTYTAGQQHRVSGAMSFDVGSFYGGNRKTVTYKGRLEVSTQLGVEPNISLNWIDLSQGRFTTTVLGGRATFTMTPRMYVAALVQYSSHTTSLSTNLRFRWEYQQGSELFLVYTEGRSTLPPIGTQALQNRGFLVKINRLFRF